MFSSNTETFVQNKESKGRSVDMVVRLLPSFQEAEQSWRSIEQESDGYVFQTFDWLSQLYHQVGKPMGVKPCLVLVETTTADPLILFPFGIHNRRFLRALVWLGDAISEYQAPLLTKGGIEYLDRTSFEVVWQKVLDILPPVDYLHLEKQPVSLGQQPNPMMNLPCWRHPSRGHITRLKGSWNAYYKSKTRAKTRSSNRRKKKQLQKLGEFKILCPATGSELDRVVETMFLQKSQYYRELGVTDLFASEHRCRFLRHMIKEHADVGLVHVAAIQVGDQIVATNLSLVYENCLYNMISSYARDTSTRFSPGTVLLHSLFQWAIENEIEMVDLGIGDDPYKDRWCEENMDIYDSIIPMNVRGCTAATLLLARLLLKRYVKSSDTLLRLAKALRRKLPQHRKAKTT